MNLSVLNYRGSDFLPCMILWYCLRYTFLAISIICSELLLAVSFETLRTVGLLATKCCFKM